IGVKGKHTRKTVVCKQTLALEPTPGELNAQKQIRRIAEVVEGFELKCEHPPSNEEGESESNELPSVPAYLRFHFGREQLSPAHPHRANVWFPDTFSNVIMASSRQDNEVPNRIPRFVGSKLEIWRRLPNAFLMPLPTLLRKIGNSLYEHAFSIYRPLYRTYKIYTDRAERQLVRRILLPGGVVVDAGANIGIYSHFLFLCVGAAGVLHSFEPSPQNFERLQSATRKLANMRLCQAAVGERSGRSKLYISDKLNVDHRTYATEGDLRPTVQIDVIALDDYFKPGQRVDLIKMDIQGYELHAWRGSKRVLADNPAAKFLLEFWPYGLEQAGTTWVEFIDTLQGKDMSIYQITNSGLVPFRSDSV